LYALAAHDAWCGLARAGPGIMQRYQVMVYDARGERLFDSTLEAPNKGVAQMLVLSQLCRNFATAPLVERADKVVVCREGREDRR
jgi:hypothetical protein